MSNYKIQAVVLAAGKSSRFNTSNTKLSYKICGQEIIAYPINILKNLNIETIAVVGYQKEIVQEIIKKYNNQVIFVEQEKQLGTGHAVICTEKYWSCDNILIINGDMPLINSNYIQEIINKHIESKSAITFATAHNPDPNQKSYGRVIKNNNKIEIVEPKDFTGNPEDNCCINAGIYLININFLKNKINLINQNNNSGEFYLTDLVKIANNSGEKIVTVDLPFNNIRGINTLKELWTAEHIKKSEIIEYWMENGVQFKCPYTTIIDYNVKLDKDIIIGQSVQILNGSVISSGTIINSNSIIDNSFIGSQVIVHPNTIISNSKIYNFAQVGPFAHIKNNSILQEQAVVGNFVEVTKTNIGKKSKAKHLSYLGNTDIGSGVNIGAGAVTCNYNGVSKNNTIIEDNAFIGSNTSLNAPVNIGKDSIVASGSVITNNIPENSLAIARALQVNKPDYANKLREKLRNKKEQKQDQKKLEQNINKTNLENNQQEI